VCILDRTHRMGKKLRLGLNHAVYVLMYCITMRCYRFPAPAHALGGNRKKGCPRITNTPSQPSVRPHHRSSAELAARAGHGAQGIHLEEGAGEGAGLAEVVLDVVLLAADVVGAEGEGAVVVARGGVVGPEVGDVEVEELAVGVEAEGEVWVVAGLVDGVVVGGEVVGGGAVVVAGCVEGLGGEGGGVEDVEGPSRAGLV
jgi:hypothetical protein